MLLRVFLRNPTMLESENYNFSKFILVVFFVQAAMIFWQNYDGIYFDDISGTFGEGASHSIGYMSLLTIAVAITMPFNTLVKGLVILLSFVINMMSSNVGFYVLFTFFLFAYYIRIQISIRSLSFLLLLVLATTALFNISLYARYSFGEFIVRRIAGVFVDPTIYDSEGKMGRPQALVYAWDLGGWFGAGSGAFSNIYQMQGYKSDTLANGRINISEFTHLLAENGLLGLLLVTSFYALMFSAMFDGVYHKLVTMVLIPFCFLYSTALTTETQFLLLSLTFYYVSKMKKPGFRPNRISSQS
jgi:hypothetical protein